MKHRKALLYGIMPIAIASLAAAGIVSARGFGGFGAGLSANLTPDQIATNQAQMFDHQAQMLGISTDEVKAAWANGTSIKDLMAQKGISQADLQAKMKTARDAQMKTHLQTLVDKGVITQAQAVARLQFMQSDAGKGKMGMGRGMRGFGF